VRDSTGRTVFSQNVAAGQAQAIVGAPPFDIVIGNAPDVTVTFRGRAVDLAPYTRQNVARLTLQ
jgi:cytoskeleton protein RodZ